MDIGIYIAEYRQETPHSTRNRMQIIFIIFTVNFDAVKLGILLLFVIEDVDSHDFSNSSPSVWSQNILLPRNFYRSTSNFDLHSRYIQLTENAQHSLIITLSPHSLLGYLVLVHFKCFFFEKKKLQ